jgi:molybdenum cofactor synthesis domain-containing protein
MIRGTVLTVSDRSAAELREDVTGPLVVSRLRAAGFDVSESQVIPDGEDSVREALTAALTAGTDFVMTLGGTGVGPRDLTPEGTAPLLGAQLPGIAEELRRVGLRTVPTAVLSRGLAGIAEAGERRAFVVNVPGSRGAAEDGLTVLIPLIPHIVDQLTGGDHG